METKTLASFGIGLVGGLVIGGAAIMLYAPKSGKDTRMLIKKRANNLVKAAKKGTDDVIDIAKDAASAVNRTGHESINAIMG